LLPLSLPGKKTESRLTEHRPGLLGFVDGLRAARRSWSRERCGFEPYAEVNRQNDQIFPKGPWR
jgi:hypothetical protein